MRLWVMNVVLLLIIRVPSYQTLYHRMLWLSAVVAMACGGCCDRMRWLLWQNNTIVVAMPDTMLYMFAMKKFLHETGCCIVIHEHTNINFVTWEKTTFPDVSVLWYFLYASLANCWYSSGIDILSGTSIFHVYLLLILTPPASNGLTSQLAMC